MITNEPIQGEDDPDKEKTIATRIDGVIYTRRIDKGENITRK